MVSALTIAAAMSALSAALLVVLAGVWIREYRSVRTPLILGMVAFILVMLLESSVALYFYVATMETLYVDDPFVRNLIAVLRSLQFVALLLFTSVSVR
ncbi:MAG: hypothetical protein BRD21_04170 [Halobacteriales archaeon SW_8_66_22]|jgi:hypothetical protein|nr:MAG: hypothetical protein BRC66_06810 [Halobacteriales archaeon QH_2_66_30]PSP60020.1 MAG: hypothetical protein BRC73_04370 [Halobacteriales archaeon QH_7_66_37]PSQ35114.1 MAG: hypothetical protein BRD08_07835 [Halobacteriales archaeon SW_10_66_29]PSQ62965.1 MAG: hypothetical protein BRD21_04170 [Halobacteriales archaeon SW_8_66_22]